MLQELGNTDNFLLLKKDPRGTISRKARKLIARLGIVNTAQKATDLVLNCAVSPEMYGIVKVHKEGYAIHTIIAGGALLRVEQYLADKLKKYMGRNLFYFRNSKDFVDHIQFKNTRGGCTDQP